MWHPEADHIFLLYKTLLEIIIEERLKKRSTLNLKKKSQDDNPSLNSWAECIKGVWHNILHRIITLKQSGFISFS